MSLSRERKLYLELLRAIAIFLVVLNHNKAYPYYLQVPQLPARLLFSGLSALVKTAVPLFFMISGALLLPKEERLGELLKKRVLRYALVLALFSLFAYLVDLRRSGQNFSLYYFVTRLYAYRFVDSYWFLYGYLAYLLALPLLRRMARGMCDRDFLYLFVLALVVQGMDLVTTFLFREELYAESSFSIAVLNYTVFYPLLGYYLEHRLPARWLEKKGLLLSFGFALLALIAMVAATEVYCRRYENWSTAGGEMFFWRLSFLVAGAIMGSLVGSQSTMGTAQLSFQFGFSGWWFTLGCCFGCLALGLIYSHRLRQSGCITELAIITREYGPASGGLSSVLCSVGIFISVFSQVIACAGLISALFPGTPLWAGALLSALLMGLYVIFGGAWGAGMGGIVKLLLLCGVSLMGLVLILYWSHGPKGLWNELNDLLTGTSLGMIRQKATGVKNISDAGVLWCWARV